MITKIQSVSDIITNSSSEAFVMTKQDAKYYEDVESDGCIDVFPITMDWLAKDGRWEMENGFAAFCDLDPTEVQGEYHKDRYFGYYDGPDEETWETFLELHKDVIEERIKDLYWVDIEDHFADAASVTDSARK